MRPLTIGMLITAAAMLAAACEPVPFPIDVRIEHEGASNPTIAVAPNGTVLVAWVATQQGAADVYLARVSPDGISRDPIRVNHVRGDASPHEQAPAQVAVGADGVVHVAWQSTASIPGRRFPASDLRYARSTDGGLTFSPTETVNDDTGRPSSHTFHDMVAGNGLLAASWLDGRVGDSIRAVDPTIADKQLPGSDIRVAVSVDGGQSFLHRAVVDTGVCPCCRTSLALGNDSTIYVSWRKVYAGNVRDVVVSASHDAGKTFGPPIRVHQDNWVYEGCPHAGPDLAMDARGRLHAAWYTATPRGPGLYHVVSADGGVMFGTPIALTGMQPPTQAKIGVDGDGLVWLAWEQRGPAGNAVVADRIEEGTWHPDPSVLGAGRSPSLASSGTHRAVAWLGENGEVRVRMGRK